MTTITKEKAAQIIDLFGPCTVVNECMEVDEVVQGIENHPEGVWDWIRLKIEIEQIHLERDYSYLGDEFPEAHAKAIAEAKEMISGIESRFKAAGYEI